MNLLVTILGPTRAGKRSVIKELIEKNYAYGADAVQLSTTRPRPEGAAETGYHHLSDHLFDRQKAAGNLLEYATYGPHRYGINLVLLQKQFERSRLLFVTTNKRGCDLLFGHASGMCNLLLLGLLPRFALIEPSSHPLCEEADRQLESAQLREAIVAGVCGEPIENFDGRRPDAIAAIQKRLRYEFEHRQ